MTDLLDAAELLGREELGALQLERLRRTLRHAYENVPFYRDAFDKAGLRPEDCRASACERATTSAQVSTSRSV
ncbi:hypothetical protein [Streptomyces sp. NPDC002889]|uniref:hypothetical protein n=1 Tax=Streptomyces sp. NPDC002889 TaxID=3364669 RepID=UPI003690D3FE